MHNFVADILKKNGINFDSVDVDGLGVVFYRLSSVYILATESNASAYIRSYPVTPKVLKVLSMIGASLHDERDDIKLAKYD